MGPPVPMVVLAAAAIPPLCFAWALHRRPPATGTTPYAGLLLLIGLWTLLEAAATLAGSVSTHRILIGGVAGLQVLWTGVWLFFALEYTGRDLRIARALLLGAGGLAVLTVGLVLADPLTELLWADYAPVGAGAAIIAGAVYGPWFGFIGLFALGALAVGLWLLLEHALADPARHGWQVGLLSLVVILPLSGVFRRVLDIGPMPNFDAAAVVTAVFVGVLWAQSQHRSLFESAAAARRVGHAAAIDDLGDAVIVLDDRDCVVELNARARELFANGESSPVGQPVSDFVGGPIQIDNGESTVKLQTPAGQRAFQVSVSSLEGPRGTAVGRTLVLADVTDEIHRRQRFEVLNRVLRHNVRNAMNAVTGYAGQLEPAVEEEDRWMIERIRRQTADLIELGERAGMIERITAPDADPESMSVSAALDAVAAALDPDAASAITVAAPPDLEVTTIRPVFEEGVAAAVMALRSAGHAPTIHLAAAGEPEGWVTVRIESDGEPVPPEEQAVIEAGEETALSHCRDLDLWLAAWSAETLGGEVEFGTAPSRIEVRVPDLPD